MPPIFIWLIAGAAVVLIVFAIAMLVGGGSGRFEQRLRGLTGKRESRQIQSGIVKRKAGAEEVKQTLSEQVFRPLSAMMGTKGAGRDKLRELLIYAGIRRKGSLEVFLGIKFLLIIALPVVAAVFLIVLWSQTGTKFDLQSLIIYAACAGILGMMLPNIWLKRKARARQENIRLTLPDALDLMVVCVEAGLGLDAAFIKISDELADSAPDLCEEMALLNLELRAGKPREECLRNFGIRTGVEEVKSLAARIVQSMKFGTNLAQSLRVHSETLRTRRRQAAEEKAAKTTIKLLFPLVFFIFPAIFVVILGPALVQISRVFGVM
jgi:tight adherence protein C